MSLGGASLALRSYLTSRSSISDGRNTVGTRVPVWQSIHQRRLHRQISSDSPQPLFCPATTTVFSSGTSREVSTESRIAIKPVARMPEQLDEGIADTLASISAASGFAPQPEITQARMKRKFMKSV
jgi:hypothetical protein